MILLPDERIKMLYEEAKNIRTKMKLILDELYTDKRFTDVSQYSCATNEWVDVVDALEQYINEKVEVSHGSGQNSD